METATKTVNEGADPVPFLTATLAARRLGVSVQTIDRLVDSGSLKVYRLPGRRAGKRWFRVQDLDALLIPAA